LSAYRKLSGAAESFLFESVEGGEHLGRYSFVGCNPRLVVKQVGDRVDVVQDGRVRESFAIKPRGTPLDDRTVYDGLAVVERILAQYRPVGVPGLPRFWGGAVGYIGYEFIHDIEPVVPRPPRDELRTPVLYFLLADQLVVFDRVEQTLSVIVS